MKVDEARGVVLGVAGREEERAVACLLPRAGRLTPPGAVARMALLQNVVGGAIRDSKRRCSRQAPSGTSTVTALAPEVVAGRACWVPFVYRHTGFAKEGALGLWWTPAHDEAARHIAKKIKAAQDVGDKAGEDRAWREYNDLHGVKFVLLRLNAARELVAEPILLVAENDADVVLTQAGTGIPPAVEAVLCPTERRDQILRSWSWNATTWERR